MFDCASAGLFSDACWENRGGQPKVTSPAFNSTSVSSEHQCLTWRNPRPYATPWPEHGAMQNDWLQALLHYPHLLLIYVSTGSESRASSHLNLTENGTETFSIVNIRSLRSFVLQLVMPTHDFEGGQTCLGFTSIIDCRSTYWYLDRYFVPFQPGTGLGLK